MLVLSVGWGPFSHVRPSVLAGNGEAGSCSWGLEVGADGASRESVCLSRLSRRGDSDCTPDGEVPIWRRGLVLRMWVRNELPR